MFSRISYAYRSIHPSFRQACVRGYSSESSKASRKNHVFFKFTAAFLIGAIIGGYSIHRYKYREFSDSQNFTYVPDTVSPLARKLISEMHPVGGEKTTLEDWRNARVEFENYTIEESVQAQERYVAHSESVMLRGVPVTVVTPKNYTGNRLMVYLHGGGYTLGATRHLYQIFAPIAFLGNLKTYSVDYRLAPENDYPAGPNDCLNVYEELLETHNPEDIVFLGDSAGGALVLSTLLKAREKKLPMPSAVSLYSPWTDINKVGDTYYTLEGRSVNINYDLSARPSAEVYVDKAQRTDPLVSPVYADYDSDFPPTMIFSGTRDLMLSCCVRLFTRMKNQGVDVRLTVREGMWHNYQERLDLPESQDSAREAAEFFKSRLIPDP